MTTTRYLPVLLLTLGMSVVIAGCAAAPPSSGGKAAPSRPFVTIGTIMPEGAPMNIFAASSLERPGMDIMPLAVSQNSAQLGAFYPALASHWQLSKNGRTVTVWLRSNAKWSNGQPVTASDVVTTMACSYAVGLMQGYGLGTATAVNAKEVRLTLAPGTVSNTFLLDVLTTEIVPASVFGHLLPSNIWAIIHTSQYTGHNKSRLAAANKALTQLTSIGNTVSAYAPPKDVSSGPFVIQAVNPGEMIMKKNPYFFAAQNVHVNEVILRNFTGSQEVWNYAISGQLDELTGNDPINIYNKAKKTPGNVPYKVPAYNMTALVFNEGIYPYNLLAVRQAFAYIINRQNVQHLGNPITGTAPKYVDGMTDAATTQWLTPAEVSSLKRYRVNLAKAASLLQHAGFKKVGSQWMLPNGKPWTATLTTVSQFSSWMVMAQVVRSELTAFGIPTKAVGMTFPQMLKAQAEGKFALSFRDDGQGPNPFFAYNRIYGSADGYVVRSGKLIRFPASDPTGGNWIDFPTTVTVPGYGKVNPGQLTAQLDQTNSPTLVRHDAQILARLTNTYVPQISMWDISFTGWVNTRQFTDFPINNSKVMVASEGYLPPIGIWMMLNYIRPRG